MAEGNGNGFELNAGPATLKATGGVVVNVLLALLLIGASFYGVWATTQQTMLIQSEHASHLLALRQEHNAMSATLEELARANQDVFLSTILTPEQKKDLPQFVQQRAKAIVERKAATVTENRQ